MNELDGEKFNVKKYSLVDWKGKDSDMVGLVEKVALQNDIPWDHVIDSERYIIAFQQGTMADSIHPDEKGYGNLAQEIYMRMSYSTNFMLR